MLVLQQTAGRRPRKALLITLGIAVALGMLALALPFALGPGPESSGAMKVPRAAARAALRPAEPVDLIIYETDVMPIASDAAMKINAERPVDIVRPSSAVPFAAPWRGSEDPRRTAAAECLATAIYYEAAVESDEGQRAVAQVILNRVRHPAFPNSVCGVVYQGSERLTGCQFSFTCDGSLARVPSRAGLARAARIASEALGGTVVKGVGNATHYHANYVVPYWSPTLEKVATIGAHIFYIMRGSLGAARAFSVRYDPGLEATPAPPAAITVDPEVLEGVPPSGELSAALSVSTPQEDRRAGTLMFEGQPPVSDSSQLPRLLADEASGELVVGKSGGLPGRETETLRPETEPKR